MSITPEQIEQVALADDDFGHEMRVGAILEDAQDSFGVGGLDIRVWPAEHGATYEDPKLGKTRQFDFRCKIDYGRRDHIKRVLLALECKNLNPEYPLVICGRERTGEESGLVFISRKENELGKLGTFSGVGSFYPPNKFVGKSVLKTKEKAGKLCKDSDSEIYDKWSQALASMHDLVFEAAFKELKPTPQQFFALPMVVVPDNSLWSLAYKNNGEPNTPSQIDHCEYYIKHQIALERPDITIPFVVTHIHFATCKGLKNILMEFVLRGQSMWDKIANPMASRAYNP